MGVSSVISPELPERFPVVVVVLSLEKARTNTAYVEYFDSLQPEMFLSYGFLSYGFIQLRFFPNLLLS